VKREVGVCSDLSQKTCFNGSGSLPLTFSSPHPQRPNTYGRTIGINARCVCVGWMSGWMYSLRWNAYVMGWDVMGWDGMGREHTSKQSHVQLPIDSDSPLRNIINIIQSIITYCDILLAFIREGWRGKQTVNQTQPNPTNSTIIQPSILSNCINFKIPIFQFTFSKCLSSIYGICHQLNTRIPFSLFRCLLLSSMGIPYTPIISLSIFVLHDV
jgi:hypothetical protein